MREKYGCAFPLFAKIEIKGEGAHPVFNHLRKNSSLCDAETGAVADIPWNFAKFLVDGQGNVIRYDAPPVDPDELIPLIEELLEK